MRNYLLMDHFEAEEEKIADKHINKALFSDKRLNKLWDKALQSGFTGKMLHFIYNWMLNEVFCFLLLFFVGFHYGGT